MNQMPKHWDEVPTYKMYDYMPVEPLYYTETTFEESGDESSLTNLNLESAIEDFGEKMET